GTARKDVMSKPFARPTSPPASTAASIATPGGHPAATTSAATTPVNAIVAPTERSIPPETMMIVIPIAPRATITVCDRTMRKLNGDRYRAGAVPVAVQPAHRPVADRDRRPEIGRAHV